MMKLNFAVCTALILVLSLLWSPPSYGQDSVSESEIFLPFVVGGQSNTEGELVDVSPEVQAATTYNFSAVVAGAAKEEWIEITTETAGSVASSYCCGIPNSKSLNLKTRVYTLTADVPQGNLLGKTSVSVQISKNGTTIHSIDCKVGWNIVGNCPNSKSVTLTSGIYNSCYAERVVKRRDGVK